MGLSYLLFAEILKRAKNNCNNMCFNELVFQILGTLSIIVFLSSSLCTYTCKVDDNQLLKSYKNKLNSIYPKPQKQAETSKIEQVEITQKISIQNSTKITHDKEFIKNRFLERNSNYDIACLNRRKPKQIDKYLGYFLTSQKYKLFSCLAMKTGSSSWFYAIWDLDNPNEEPPKPRFWSIMAGRKKFLNNKQKLQVSKKRSESYFLRFMTTRHPLSRLYSGWNEHMRVKDGKPVGGQWRLFGLTDKSKWSDTHVCTWEKFIELFTSGKYRINDHHASVSKLCYGCDINWEYIIKQETMDEDNEFLLRTIGAPDGLHVGYQNSMGGDDKKRDPYAYLKNYCQFDDETIKKVEDYYSEDLLLYSYDKFNRSEICI